MPHHPSEEEAPSGLTDKVAQHSRDSTASDHPLHDENKGPVEQGGAEAFKSSPGPQIVESMSTDGCLKGKEKLIIARNARCKKQRRA